MFQVAHIRHPAFNLTLEKWMQTARLAMVRRTKLDLAQWIAAGIGQCRNPATSQCLARYAAAQLESAALIPVTGAPERNHQGTESLLRRELKHSHGSRERDCVLILARVSRAMVAALADNRPRHPAIAHLIRHEALASRQIRALSRG